eukprot:TRINITY_DN3317_c0_g2_i2.p1 TRINITY_DN3317_c0_g2~~TRINITY_DN3317_c0_g2_i2.p1  ORF type:complete len:776 (+),score=285.83 TRINITY_DN3317_c0_g2_i2:264-2330(+)
MAQYHALGLLYQMRVNDRLAKSKIVSEMTKSTVRSPYAYCLLIKIATRVLTEGTGNPKLDASLYDFLELCLRHKGPNSTMVILEAAKALCDLPNQTSKSLIPAISALQSLICVPRNVVKFAAIRTLNKIGMKHPVAVSVCNSEMENLIGGNRSIATLAITTLLKTGNESSVDSLMKQISSFMGEISDDFKITVVEAIKSLCIKFPKKQHSLLGFLSQSLKKEGGVSFKTAIVNAIFVIINKIPQAKDNALGLLCEFIEDCEFTSLCSNIIYELGEAGPTTNNPAQYIRYIYNRVLLEPAIVRLSAVNALAKFGRRCPQLRQRIITILKRCLVDSEEEVRDKAAFHLSMLQKEPELASKLFEEQFVIPIDNLEVALQKYLANPSLQPFDISSVSLAPPKKKKAPEKKNAFGTAGRTADKKKKESSGQDYAKSLSAIPELSGLGNLFRSSNPISLTESDTEYSVTCVKHIFNDFIVLQFDCVNTLSDQLLEDVHISLEPEEETEYSIVQEIHLPSLPYDTPGSTYIVLDHSSAEYEPVNYECTMIFTIKDIDSSTGEVNEFDEGYEDEYSLETLEINLSDYIAKVLVPEFPKAWQSMGNEVIETYSLANIKNLNEAISELIKFLGMAPCEGSQKLKKKTKHILYLSGVFVGNIRVLARARMKLDPNEGVDVQLTVRSQNESISSLIASSI